MGNTTVVLDTSAGNIEIARKVASLSEAFSLHEINFDYVGPFDVTPNFTEYVYLDHKTGAEMKLIDDYVNDIMYISLESLPEKSSASILSWVTKNLPSTSLAEAKRLLSRDLEDHKRLVINLGLMSEPDSVDVETEKLLIDAMNSSDAETVELALVASQLLGWPGLHDSVHRLTFHDDPSVRHLAEMIAAQISPASHSA